MDNHSRVGTEWIPQAGVAVHLPRAVELKASATKGFRYPILREMYMFPPQNPDLKPESMWNYEIALSQSLLNGCGCFLIRPDTGRGGRPCGAG